MQNNKDRRPVILTTMIGALIGCCFLFYAFITAFGICSDSTVTELLFPYAVLVDPSLSESLVIILLLALIQWPLYGFFIGLAWTRAPLRSIAVCVCSVLLITIHSLAVMAAHHRVEEMWGKRFADIKTVSLVAGFIVPAIDASTTAFTSCPELL